MKTRNKAKTINFKLKTKVYPLEVVLNTAYLFTDRAYVQLDQNTNYVNIQIELKDNSNRKDLLALKGDFCNSLLNEAIRLNLMKYAGKIREYIVARALLGAVPNMLEEEKGAFSDKNKDWINDPLGIAVPWEKKYRKKSVSKSNKT